MSQIVYATEQVTDSVCYSYVLCLPNMFKHSLRTVLRSIKHLDQQVVRTIPQDQLWKVFAAVALGSVMPGVCSSSLEISCARCLQQ